MNYDGVSTLCRASLHPDSPNDISTQALSLFLELTKKEGKQLPNDVMYLVRNAKQVLPVSGTAHRLLQVLVNKFLELSAVINRRRISNRSISCNDIVPISKM